MHELSDVIHSQSLKWIFVGGKGGVGKTTTSCSLAIELAKRRESVLLLSTDPAHNISDALCQKFSGEPQKVNGFTNLYAMEIDPNRKIDSFAGDCAKLDFGDNPQQSQSFMQMIGEMAKSLPGVDEAVSFAELMQSVKKMSYSTIVFDTAPTGHTLRLLAFPKMIEKGFGALGSLKDSFGDLLKSFGGGDEGLQKNIAGLNEASRGVQEMFQNPELCTFICVCIPEFLSVYETERLVQELTEQEIDVTNIIVNQILMRDECSDCRKCNARRSVQRKYLQQIKDLYCDDFNVIPMGLQDDEVRGKKALEYFAGQLLKSKASVFDELD